MKLWSIFLNILETVLFVLIIYFCVTCAREKHETYDFEEATAIETMVISAKYEKLIDSTARYIYTKYGEFLPDTYWKGNPVYEDLYDDLECWDRNYLK